MFFSLPSADFKEALRNARLAAPPGSKTTLPILGTLHLRVTPDCRHLEVSSTDLDVLLIQRIPLDDPGSPGAVCIPISALSSIRPDKGTPVILNHSDLIGRFAKGIPATQLRYTAGGNAVTVELDHFPEGQFPPFLIPDPEDFTILLTHQSLAAIGNSIPFQSQDENRYVLNGVLLSPQGGGSIVATDGRRMLSINAKACPVDCIVPRKACQILAGLKITTAAAAITHPPNRHVAGNITFRSGPFHIHSKLIFGNFPNYRQIIPQDCTSAITFADPVGIASWLATLPESRHTSAVDLKPRPPHSVDLHHPSGRFTVTALLQGRPPDITFNPKFLADALTAVPGTLHLSDARAPGMFRLGSSTAVLMPITIARDPKAAPDTPPG